MALSPLLVWEVRSAGSDNSGGAFKEGAAGTDYSQQDAAQYSGTNLTVDGTDNTKVVPDGHTPVAADVGNVVQITAGAGFTLGFYEITAQDGTNWTLDRSPAAVSTSGGTWAMGGALATPLKATQNMVSQNHLWVKNGSYTTASALTLIGGSGSGRKCEMAGYNTTRGDLDGPATANGYTNCPVITVNNAAINALNLANSYSNVRNFKLDAGAGATKGAKACYLNASYCHAENLWAVGAWSGSVMHCAVQGTGFIRCKVDRNGSAGIQFYIGTTQGWAIDCIANNSDGDGFQVLNNSWVVNCIAYNCDGHGFYHGSTYGGMHINCIAYGNGGDGFRANAASSADFIGWFNCIAYGNTGYGFNSNSTDWSGRYPMGNNNAYGGNTAGNHNKLPTATEDVTLTADPFVNAASGDFNLNATAGGGADLKAAASAGHPEWGASGNKDIGPYQTAAGAGSSGVGPGRGAPRGMAS